MKGVEICVKGVQKWSGVSIMHQEVIQQRLVKGGGNMAKGGAKVVGCKY